MPELSSHFKKVLKEEYTEFNLGHFADIKTLQQLVEQRINIIIGQDLTINEFLEIVESN